MLSPSDLDLLRRDPALPGLAVLLDPTALSATLGQVLGDATDPALHVPYLRYKPGMNCLATLATEASGEFPLGYAKAHPLTEREKLAKARQRTAHPALAFPHAPHPRWVMESLGLELNLFPNDNKLPGLERVTSLPWASELVRRALDDASLEVTRIEALAYKPERRWVARWELSNGRSLVAKTCTAAAYPVTQARALAPRPAESPLGPRCIGHRDRYATLLYEWIEGAPLHLAWRSAEFDPRDLRAVGRALAALHRSPLPPAAEVIASDSDAGLSRLDALATCLAHYLPAVAPSLAELIRDGLRPGWTATSTTTPGRVWCHGDFHSRQVLLRPEGIAFLDFDECRPGDPAMDLGDFLASLEIATLRELISPARRDALATEFLAGYAAESPESAWRPRLAQQLAFGLLARTPHFFRTRDPHWEERTQASVQRMRELLGLGQSARPNPPSVRIPLDSALPTLAAAMDPATAGAAVAAALQRHRQLSGLEFRAVELRRHKRGRRGLLRYEFANADGGVFQFAGKIQRRGIDARRFEQWTSLARGEFAAASPDGLSIPEPLATVPALQMTLQRWCPGRPLTELLAIPATAIPAVRRAAEAVHKLHGSRPTPALKPHTLSDELAILGPRLRHAAEELPEHAASVERVLEACAELADTLPVGRPVTIHRDFYPDQVLVEGDRIHLLDLDLLALGDPALDAGNFLAHVTEHALRHFGDATALMAVENAFRERFLALSPSTAIASVEAYRWLALARLVDLSLCLPGRRAVALPLLRLCHEALDSAPSRTAGFRAGVGSASPITTSFLPAAPAPLVS